MMDVNCATNEFIQKVDATCDTKYLMPMVDATCNTHDLMIPLQIMRWNW
jgi:hypothetical protein